MTNYNDGKWHGWNGGECPVHHKTWVRGIEQSGVVWTCAAGDNDWNSFRGAFMVIKEYIEPREWWFNPKKGLIQKVEPTHTDSLFTDFGYIKVREVSQ